MSQVCDVCGKTPQFGHRVSRLGRGAMKRRVKARANRRWTPNIQTVRAVVKGSTKRIHACTSCIKANKVVKAG